MTNQKLVPVISCDEFARNLAESGLFDASELLPPAGLFTSKDGVGAARELVAAGRLTMFQADAVLEGRVSDLRMGNYEILDRLGSGGMGTVYKARHRRMKRLVALKVLSSNVAKSPTFASRFQREVETIAKLTHPNIVMAFDADEGEAGPFLVMEFVNGRDLAYELTVGGPMSMFAAVDSILQAALGLAYAHERSIIHRDIKPGNLLRDASGVVKVADLGLARLSTSEGDADPITSLTQAGGVLGTADYMAPEQALDSTAIDCRADIYSLGCTLFFLLTGRPPFQGSSVMSLLLKHRDAAIPSLVEARADAPPELEIIFKKMMAKNPGNRFQAMVEIVQALDDLMKKGQLGKNRPLSAGQSESVSASPSERTALFESTATPMTGAASYISQLPAETGIFTSTPDVPRPPRRVAVLVETSRTQAGIIRRYLQQLGMEVVHITGSGLEALKLATKERAEVIVSSMHLSDITGVKLADAMLLDDACKEVGFILATSESDALETESIPKSPRVVVMSKPFDLERLKQSIAAIRV